MKKSNIKIMSAVLTLTLSGSSFCLTSCGNFEKEDAKVEGCTFLGNTTNIDKIFNKSNINYLISELKNYGVVCDYSEKLNSLEVSSIEGYDFSEMPDRFYTLFNDLLGYTSIDHLCCFSKELAVSLDFSKLDLGTVKHLGLFGNDDTLNYVNNTPLSVESLCVLLDKSSLSTNKLNLNIQGIESVTILSGNFNVVELGNVSFTGTKESELILSGVSITKNTSFNCNNVKISLNGIIEDTMPLTDLRNVEFEYHDHDTEKVVSYNPNSSDIDEIVGRIKSINSIRTLKRENM